MQNTTIASKSLRGGGLDNAGGLFHASGLSRSAFTLAEVLITLGIIGVVAAMTMPSLIGKYQEKVLINQAKKSYSIIQNALVLTKANEEASSYGDIFRADNTSDETADIIFKNMQVVERCYSDTTKGCGGTSYKIKQQYRKNDGYGNVAGSSILTKYSRAILKDGTIIGITQTKYPETACQNYYTAYDKDADGNYILDADGNKTGERLVPEKDCGHIFFDVNGLKGPNQYGQDAYLIYVTDNDYVQSLGRINDVLSKNKLTYDKFQEGGKFKE